MEHVPELRTRIVERPARKLILMLSRAATDYFSYVEEVGCDESGNSMPWDTLKRTKYALDEPVGVWLPERMRPADTGSYAHAVEVHGDWVETLPSFFDMIDLEPATYIRFQGEPYDDADYSAAVGECMAMIDAFDPTELGYEYAPDIAPRMQLEPQGSRGYIEMRPVKAIR